MNKELEENIAEQAAAGETHFYRDKKQMELLENVVLPALINYKRKTGDLSLRIWSAGCASGEEIYTIAMMLTERLPDIRKWTLHLIGSDINADLLRKAIGGVYPELSMQTIPEKIKMRYFKNSHQHYILNDNIRNMVKFDYLNLHDNTYPSIFNGTHAQDLILCRNVLTGFDNAMVVDIMQKFHASTQTGGYVLLGATDPVDAKATHNIFAHEDLMLFRREEDDEKQSSHKATKIEEKTFSTHETKPIPEKTDLLDLIQHADWQTILHLLDGIDINSDASGTLAYAKGTALANVGQLAPAAKLLASSLKQDPKNKYSHFTYALILLEMNDIEQAENELRQALSLDKQFVIGHYQLGLLLMRQKQDKTGLKLLTNALNIAQTKKPEELVDGSRLSYSRLSEMLEHEIALYTAAENNGHR